MTHICVSKLTTIGSDNGLSPGHYIWTNAGILLIGPLRTNFSEILIKINPYISRKCIWICCLENGGHFVSASMCWMYSVLSFAQILVYLLFYCNISEICPVCMLLHFHIFNKNKKELFFIKSMYFILCHAEFITPHWGRVTLLCVNKLP